MKTKRAALLEAIDVHAAFQSREDSTVYRILPAGALLDLVEWRSVQNGNRFSSLGLK
jgi:hypothetical protein